MSKKEEPIWKTYIDFQETYSTIYGEKTICFMQVGSFYEIYSLTNTGYIKNVCEIMDAKLSSKNITDMQSGVNPFMAGVPDHGVKKFLDRLIAEDYTIVIIDQIGEKNSKGKYEKRAVTKILTKANIDIFFEINNSNSNSNSNTNDNSNILSLYIEEEKAFNGKIVLSIGMSIIDISTGINHIYEINSSQYEIFEEMYRFIETYNPVEIVIHTVNLKMYSENEILSKINTVGRKYYYNFYNQSKTNVFYKLSYKEEFLKKIFKNNSLLNIFEHLNLQKYQYALNSYIILLQFAYEHEIHIINKIRKPEIFENKKHLNLYHNALYQLDVVPSQITAKNMKNTLNSKYQSLFDVINNTSTAFGRRELRERLLNPITDVNELRNRYKMVEIMQSHVDKYENYLKNI